MTKRIRPVRDASLAVVLGILLATVGCSSDKRAHDAAQSLARARLAIEVTKSSDATHYAQGELAVAGEKLAEAREASAQGNYKKAHWLISEALVNVDLARAKVDAELSKTALSQAKKAAGTVPGSTPGAP